MLMLCAMGLALAGDTSLGGLDGGTLKVEQARSLVGIPLNSVMGMPGIRLTHGGKRLNTPDALALLGAERELADFRRRQGRDVAIAWSCILAGTGALVGTLAYEVGQPTSYDPYTGQANLSGGGTAGAVASGLLIGVGAYVGDLAWARNRFGLGGLLGDRSAVERRVVSYNLGEDEP